MRPDSRDAAYLWDMLAAARLVMEFTAGMRLSEYLKDRKTQSAVERQVEIIGEAARQVSEPFCRGHGEIPWRKIIAQRNVLAHEYGEIRQERMWELVEVHLPQLVSVLEKLIPSPPL